MADIEAIECFESDCLWCARVSNENEAIEEAEDG